MNLPKVPLPSTTVDIAGAVFDVRSLTRAEAAHLQKMVQDGATLAAIECAAIAYSTDTPLGEVEAWYENVPSQVPEELMVVIRDISRLNEGAQKSG